MLETNLPSTSQDLTSTSEHAPNLVQELLTLLRPAMVRVDELVRMQSESMRTQREMMGAIFSLTLRLDAMAATRSQSVDDRRPESDQMDWNRKKSVNEEQSEHGRKGHCEINSILKESISTGVAEAKAELLASINALAARIDANSKGIGKLLELQSSSPTLSHQKLDSQMVGTDSSPISRKRRHVDLEKENAMTDAADQANATLNGNSKCNQRNTPMRLESLQIEVQELPERLKDSQRGIPEPERHSTEPSSSPTIEIENHLPSVNDTSTMAGPIIEAQSTLSSSVNTNLVPNRHSTTVHQESDQTPTNAGCGSVSNPTDLATCDASLRPTTTTMIQQLPITSEDLQQQRSGFLFNLATHMEKRGTPLPPSLTGIEVPNYNHMDSVRFIERSEKVGFFKLAGRDVDLFLLWATVISNGGAKAITSSDSWARILPHFNLPERFPDAQVHGSTSVAFTLSKYYCSILYPFELLCQRNLQAQQSSAQPEQ